MGEIVNSLVSYFQQGGPWMIALFVCSVWTWAVFVASVFPKARKRSDAVSVGTFEQLERASNTLVVLAVVAPLIGLLGTVSGMISAFRVLSSWMGMNPRNLASAISEALITTQTGLTIAVPAMLGAHIFEQSRERIRRKW
ncbi:MotA/TolQ/ExbB proton channel family protein [Thermodesulforhabdus norvegica]|uniref:MotA/TolQ/ExbB proton channel family protein n=1 Tax=Thermodesulforhabdus norvegica TaxID=39841 RepID=A0A1I4QX23_9BACT|nr:MotA/TolQ/ExbB proton channel family protein [Thermodesulforhabdus norvegica]SFM44561.1 MotA/TolQ/ExbB proton channel family protein [Thermodesulforhabdus norvegica]